jgi:glutathione S-transferase
MITVHHLNNSRSQRVLWLLEELRQIHPLGKSPLISDGPLTLAESGAIIEYLVGRYGAGRLAPAPTALEHVRYIYWLHYAEGSAMTPLLLKLVVNRIESGAPLLIRPVARKIAAKLNDSFVGPQLKLHLDYMEAELGNSNWFVGQEFTAADIQMSFPLEVARMRAGLDASRPRLMNFLQRIHARPAYLRALERGGTYELLK